MNKPILLTTPRLKLREVTEADLDAVHSYFSDLRVVEHAPIGPNTLNETLDWLKNVLYAQNERPRLVYGLAITKADGGELIGSCNVSIRDQANREGVIGYTLRFEAWGQGYATETARALLAFAFGPLALHRVIATTSPLNVASHRVLEKTGMEREGLMKSHLLMRGKWRDSLLYAVINPNERDTP
jgi:RimJ/RimL family protein N-acetyltransferase